MKDWADIFTDICQKSFFPVQTFHMLLDLTPEQLLIIYGVEKKQRTIEHAAVPGPDFYQRLLADIHGTREQRLARARAAVRRYRRT